MPVEVVDMDASHRCSTGPECDIHRARRWIKTLKETGYPDEELEAFYTFFTEKIREGAHALNSLMFYQDALVALVGRAGGHVRIQKSEIPRDGTILDPDVDTKTEEVVLKLSTVDAAVTRNRVYAEKAEALEESAPKVLKS